MTLPVAITTTDLILWMPDALHAFLVVWLFFVGSCVGSFLNVVIYRLPIGMSVARTGSHCPSCGHPVRWYDNVPLFSWINLRGRCRDCGTWISGRYPLVELLVAALFLLLAFGEGFQGGGNLPRWTVEPPFSEMPGFGGWSIYTYHLALLVTLVATALLQYGAQAAPRQLFLPALGIGLLGPVLLPHLHPVSFPGDLLGNERVAGLSSSLLGLIVGAVLGWLASAANRYGSRRSLAGRSGLVEHRPVPFAWAICGLFLGWQAVSAIAAATSLLVLAHAAILRLLPACRKWPVTASLTLVTVLYILNWGRLAEHFPMLQAHGAVAIAGLSGVLGGIGHAWASWLLPAREPSRMGDAARQADRPPVSEFEDPEDHRSRHPDSTAGGLVERTDD